MLRVRQLDAAHRPCLSTSLPKAFLPAGTSSPAELGVICELTEGAFDPLVRITDKKVKQNSSITLVLSAEQSQLGALHLLKMGP